MQACHQLIEGFNLYAAKLTDDLRVRGQSSDRVLPCSRKLE